MRSLKIPRRAAITRRQPGRRGPSKKRRPGRAPRRGAAFNQAARDGRESLIESGVRGRVRGGRSAGGGRQTGCAGKLAPGKLARLRGAFSRAAEGRRGSEGQRHRPDAAAEPPLDGRRARPAHARPSPAARQSFVRARRRFFPPRRAGSKVKGRGPTAAGSVAGAEAISRRGVSFSESVALAVRTWSVFCNRKMSIWKLHAQESTEK